MFMIIFYYCDFLLLKDIDNEFNLLFGSSSTRSDTMKKVTTTLKAPKAIGPYSQSITSDSKNTIYVSGQLPVNPATSEIPADIAGQTE